MKMISSTGRLTHPWDLIRPVTCDLGMFPAMGFDLFFPHLTMERPSKPWGRFDFFGGNELLKVAYHLLKSQVGGQAH